MLIYVSSNQMYRLRHLANATDAQQSQAPHRFVSLQSLVYTGRFRLVLHWQVTVSSDHLYSVETARPDVRCMQERLLLQQSRGPWATWDVPRAHPRFRYRRVCRVHYPCCVPQSLQAAEQTAHEREWAPLHSGAAMCRAASHSRLRFTLAKDCCERINEEYIKMVCKTLAHSRQA